MMRGGKGVRWRIWWHSQTKSPTVGNKQAYGAAREKVENETLTISRVGE